MIQLTKTNFTYQIQLLQLENGLRKRASNINSQMNWQFRSISFFTLQLRLETDMNTRKEHWHSLFPSHHLPPSECLFPPNSYTDVLTPEGYGVSCWEMIRDHEDEALMMGLVHLWKRPHRALLSLPPWEDTARSLQPRRGSSPSHAGHQNCEK